MSVISENKLKKSTCEQMYVELEMSMDDISVAMGVNNKTLYKWKLAGGWDDKRGELQAIERAIEKNLRNALNKGLKAYAEKPEDKDLQSLVSLLKQFKEKNKPSQAYKDHILRFLDKTTDFLLERNMSETANVFKGCVVDLAEYLLNRA